MSNFVGSGNTIQGRIRQLGSKGREGTIKHINEILPKLSLDELHDLEIKIYYQAIERKWEGKKK